MSYLLYILSSFSLGALHALEPGHGKAVIGAYLVGSRGRAIDAVILGIVVTFTHTGIVILLGILSSVAAEFFVPEQVEKVLGVVSGALIVAVGLWMIVVRWHQVRGHGHGHDHNHTHTHEHEHDHSPQPDQPYGLVGLIGLGISGGVVPCPAALAVLLAAIGISGFIKAVGLVIVFSMGMASALVVIGLVLVGAGKYATGRIGDGRLTRSLPVASAVIVTVVGVVLTIHSIRTL